MVEGARDYSGSITYKNLLPMDRMVGNGFSCNGTEVTPPAIRSKVVRLLYRHQGNRTQKEFAAQIGISSQYLSDIYHGKRKGGEKILSFLGLDRKEIYPKAHR